MPRRAAAPSCWLCGAFMLAVSMGCANSWAQCEELPLELTAWPGTFGATVTTPILEIINSECLHSKLKGAFSNYRLLAWSNQQLSPDDEVDFMKLLPHDSGAPPERSYGPLGTPGVEAERYQRWRVPKRKEVLLQGEGKVPSGHHGVAPGHLTSGKPVKEWHTDGLYEQATPSIATSMYCISVKPSGGDTLFMDARAIYDALDAEETNFWECATAHYSRIPLSMHQSGYRALLDKELANTSSNTGGLYSKAKNRSNSSLPSSIHPAVWQLSDGDMKKALIVSPMWMAKLIDKKGAVLSHDEMQHKIEAALLKGKATETGKLWAPGDFVVWDNRALLHSAMPNSGFSAEGLRLLHRVRLCGDEVPKAPAACTVTS